MAQFKHHIRLSMKEEWNKHDIKGVITVLDKAIANIFEPREDGTAVVYHMLDDFHVYDFRMNRAVTEAEAEVVLQLLQKWTDKDFTMEITTSEKFDIPDGEVITIPFPLKDAIERYESEVEEHFRLYGE